MSGYTDGVAKELSKKSLGYGLNTEVLGIVEDDFSNLTDLLDENFSSEFTADDLASLKNYDSVEFDGYDEGEESNIFIVEGTNELCKENSWMSTFEDLSEGSLLFITNQEKEVLGVKLGAAGEHIGSVSVWVDTFEGVIKQGGISYPMSDNDIDELNEEADMLYNC